MNLLLEFAKNFLLTFGIVMGGFMHVVIYVFGSPLVIALLLLLDIAIAALILTDIRRSKYEQENDNPKGRRYR